MNNVKQLDDQLNSMVLGGQAMEAYEKFYAENVVMQENDSEPTVGKAVNREREIQFFSSIEQFHSASVKASAVQGNVSFGEWEMDITFKGGARTTMRQVAVRKWKDGQIIHEKFYYNGSH